MASTGHGSKPQGKSAAVALGITFLALLGLVLTELLSKVMPGIPQPMPWGMPIAIVIVAATILRFLLENALASEPQHIEKYTLEMSMAGTVALVSLAIVQLHDSTVDRFQAGTLILNGVGYASESSLETAAVLSALAFLVTGVCILAAFLSKRFKEGDLETVIRALSVPILVLSYVLFFMTVIYVK